MQQFQTATTDLLSSFQLQRFSIFESEAETYLIISAKSIIHYILSFCQDPKSTWHWLHSNWTEGCPCSYFRRLLLGKESIFGWMDHPCNKF